MAARRRNNTPGGFEVIFGVVGVAVVLTVFNPALRDQIFSGALKTVVIVLVSLILLGIVAAIVIYIRFRLLRKPFRGEEPNMENGGKPSSQPSYGSIPKRQKPFPTKNTSLLGHFDDQMLRERWDITDEEWAFIDSKISSI